MVQANGAFIDGRLDVLGEYKAALKAHFESDIQEVRRVINCLISVKRKCFLPMIWRICRKITKLR